MNEQEQLLRKIYYDPALGLGTAKSLYNIVKKDKIDYATVKRFVNKQEVNQIFHTKKNIVYPAIIGDVNDYQADLMFLEEYKTKNEGYNVIFTIIELTTRKAYAYPMKGKTKANIVEAFNSFLSDVKKVNNLTTDNGSEFISGMFKSVVDKNNITHHFAEVGDKNKLGKIERFNRTVRDKIKKYMKTFKTLTWINVLDKLIDNYNNSIHSRTGIAPNNVNTKQAEEIRNKEKARSGRAYEVINSFSVGDKVRILKKKKLFDKGGERYSKGIYTVVEVDKMALIVKNSKGVVLDKRIKPYEVNEVDEVEEAPEKQEDSTSLNKRAVVKERNLKKDFDNVKNGEVVIPKKLIPLRDKRVEVKRVEKGTRVKAWFILDGVRTLYNGTVDKVNTVTYKVIFDDGEVLYLKKDEVEIL